MPLRFAALLAIVAFLALFRPVYADGPIDNGISPTGTIDSTSNPADTWTFSASSGDIIYVQIGVSDSTNYSLDISLHDPDGLVVGNPTGNSEAARIDIVADKDGPYEIQVTNSSGSQGWNATYTLYLAKIPGSGVPPEGDEGGELTNGGVHPGTIDPADMDIWTFHVNALETVYVQVGEVGNTGLSPHLFLFGPNGSPIDNNYDDVSTQVNYQALVAGTYTVLLRSHSASLGGSGDYRLYFARMPGDPDLPDHYFLPENDQGGDLTNGGEHSGTIELGDMDLWTFDADAGDTIYAQVGESGGIGLKPHLLLFGPDGDLVVNSDGLASASIDYRVGTEQTHIITNQRTAAGTYTLMVKDETTGDANGSGDYRLYFARIPGNYSIPGGDQGGPLTNGGVHTGTIALGDLDLWTLQADALDTISIQVTKTGTNDLEPRIILFGPDGKSMGNAGDASGPVSASIDIAATVAGTYTLLVRDRHGDASGSGDYSLTYSLTPDTTTAPAGLVISELQNGGHVAGTFADDSDIDLYSLGVNAGDQVRLQVGDPSGGSDVSPGLQVFASDGSLLADSGHSNEISRVDIRAAASDTLTVVVSNVGGAANNHDYDLYSAVIPRSVVTPPGDEGGVLVNGSVAAGSWFPRGDMDLYTLQVNEGDAVRIQLGEYATSHVSKDPDLEVFASDGSLVATTLFGEGKTARVAFTATATETLTILTRNKSNGDTADYRLSASVVPQGFITPAGDEGGVLLDGVIASGTWSSRADMDLYTYSHTAGSPVNITLECLSVCGAKAAPVLQVYSSGGSLLGITKASAANTYSIALGYTAAVTDTLYLLVFNNVDVSTSSESSAYSLAVSGVTSIDSDGDGLTDALEALIGSDNGLIDTDGDGISDFDEVNYDGDASSYDPDNDLNPLLADTDGDGVDDATELAEGTDPLGPVLPGDVNLDGLVDPADCLKLIQFVLGIGANLTSASIVAGDLNGNSLLDAGDIAFYPGVYLGF